MSATDDVLARQFTDHRTRLLGVAYRLTSSLADAEDAVQEAWLRLSGLDTTAREGIRDLPVWLTTVVGRICLDQLRSAVTRRERYVGPWLPEPLVTALPGQPAEDPADVVAREDGVRMAVLVVLDRLSPEQRVAFVLHDAFEVPFTDIADVLGCSVDTARQYASRGRRTIADADPPPRVDLAVQQELLGRLMAALASADIAAVTALLHPDAVIVGDGGGKARTARRIIRGRDKIARFAIGLLQRYGDAALTGVVPVLVNGDAGMLVPAAPGDAEHPPLDRRVVTCAVEDGLLAALYDMTNPDKLTTVPF